MKRRKLIATASAMVVGIATGFYFWSADREERVDPSAAPLLDISERVDHDDEVVAYRDLHGSRRTRTDESIVVEPESAFVRGQVLVAFEPGATAGDRRRVLADIRGRSIRTIPGGTEVVEVRAATTVDRARRILARSPHVAFAEPNFIYRAALRPNDPLFTEQWALENPDAVGLERGGADIDASAAWDATTGDPAATVAVIDTGVAYDHPDLDDNIWSNPLEAAGASGVDDDRNGHVDDVRGWDWVDDDPDPLDEQGHGTHVAGTIGAEGNNRSGTTGVTWDVSIMPLRVLNASGSGSAADVAAALTYAARAGASVVNASLSGPGRSQALESAITAAPNTLFVVAAGNEAANNDTTPSYPCNYPQPNVLCVAATGRDDRLASFSNHGATSVDIAAPGTRILSTVPAVKRVFAERFQDLSRWSSTGGPGWSFASDAAGGYATDSPAGSYAPAAVNDIVLRDPITLDSAQRCSLAYTMRLDTEARDDPLRVQVSDGQSWTTLASWSGSTSGHWVDEVDRLPYEGETGLRIRFRLEPDGDGTVGDGVGLDDVSVTCILTSYSGTEFAYFSGTSMATPHVAGAAALLVAGNPALTSTRLTDLLMAGAEPIADLFGKTVGGARLDIARSLRILLTTGPSPLQQPKVELAPTVSAMPGAEPFTESPPAAGSPTPTPEASATGPSPSPSETDREVGERRVSLVLRRHLVARGRVVLPDGGDDRCRANVTVQLLRNGRKVAEVTTAPDGAYRLRLKDRSGLYRARVRRVHYDDISCAFARSTSRRHAH